MKKADIIWEQKRDSFIQEVQQVSEIKEKKKTLSEDAAKLLDTAAEHETGQVL